MNIYVQNELESITKVPETRNYWFVRTYGGELYDEYLEKGYVGIGMNAVPLSVIKKAKTFEPVDVDPLARLVDSATDYKKGESTKWAKQLIAFCHEAKIGDTIIMPSKNSEELAIGTITGDVYQVSSKRTFQHRDQTEPYPEKRRNVEWNKRVSKTFYNGDLRNLISSQGAITKANFYSETIEGSLNNLFIKDEKMHLVIEVGTDEAINAFDLQRFLGSLTFFYSDLCKEYGYDDNEDLTVKIKLQSKGKMMLQGFAMAALVGVAGLVVLCNDSEVELNLKEQKVTTKSKGFLQSLSDYKDRDQARSFNAQIMEDSIRRLRATTDSIIESKEKASEPGKESGEKSK